MKKREYGDFVQDNLDDKKLMNNQNHIIKVMTR